MATLEQILFDDDPPRRPGGATPPLRDPLAGLDEAAGGASRGPSGDGAPREVPIAPVEELDAGLEGLRVAGGAGSDESQETLRAAEQRRQRLLERRRNLRIDTSTFEEPQRDTRRRRLNQILTGAGAISTLLGATFGEEGAAAAGSGLARGAATNLERQRTSFRRRRKAFRETLREARQFNRDLELSISEAQTRAAESQTERAFERAQSERERTAERQSDQQAFARKQELIKLRDRLDDELSERERRLLDEEIASQEALTTERRTQADANRALARKRRGESSGSASGTDEERPYAALSDQQLQSLAEQTSMLVRTGMPASADTDETGTISQVEREIASIGGQVPSTSDIGNAGERLSQIRAEMERRGLLTDGGGGAAPPAGDRIENRTTFMDTQPPQSDAPSGRQGGGQGGGRRDTRPAPSDTTRSQTGPSGGYVERLNRTLRQRGRAATLDTILTDMDEGRITPRQARRFAQQVVPDSVASRVFQ